MKLNKCLRITVPESVAENILTTISWLAGGVILITIWRCMSLRADLTLALVLLGWLLTLPVFKEGTKKAEKDYRRVQGRDKHLHIRTIATLLNDCLISPVYRILLYIYIRLLIK